MYVTVQAQAARTATDLYIDMMLVAGATMATPPTATTAQFQQAQERYNAAAAYARRVTDLFRK